MAAAVSVMQSHLRRMFRAALGPASILTLEDVLVALPGRPEDTEQWLVEHVAPIGDVLGEPVYRWGEVCAAITEGVTAPKVLAPAADRMLTERETASRLGVSVKTLRRHIGRLPHDLQPAVTGTRRHRRYWRESAVPALVEALRTPPVAPAATPAEQPAKGNHGGGYPRKEHPRGRLIDRVRKEPPDV